MREILFRGKSKDTEEWIYGDLLQYADTAQIWKQTEDGKWNCIVDPSTVCQYTGLTEKNGRKIFEGDIVKDGNIYGAVVFDSHYAQFMIDDVYDGHQEYSDWWHEVEVIGNIFDNPELIGE